MRSEGDVGSVDERVALDGVVVGEVGDVAVVDGGLVRAEVEVVAEVEEEIGGRHRREDFGGCGCGEI